MPLLSNARYDLSGALAAAATTVPTAISFGMMAFAPLGPAFASHGALAGIYGAVFGGLCAALFGSIPFQISGPKASLALISASVAAGLVLHPPLPGNANSQIPTIAGLILLCVCLGGLFQVILGLVKAGSLIKLTPYPVYAGLMNGVGILVVTGQVKPLLGVDEKVPLLELLTNPSLVEPASAAAGGVALLVMYAAHRSVKRVPAPLIGLTVGSLVYHGLVAGPPGASPHTIGTVKISVVYPRMFGALADLASEHALWSSVSSLLAPALVLGLLASMNSLLSSMAADNYTAHRHDSNRELIGQGVGNMVSASFNGIAVAGSVPRTIANFEAGGRTRMSGVFFSTIILLVIVCFGSSVGKIPVAAVSAVLIAVGFRAFDSWSIGLLRKFVANRARRREIVGSALLSLAVTLVVIFADLLLAVAFGFIVASVLFAGKLGQSVVRSEYRGNKVHSRKVRSIEMQRVLETEGHRIAVFELQGPVFFGSADNLARRILSSVDTLSCCILDLRKVGSVDSTGANIIAQIHRRLKEDGRRMALSGVGEFHPLWQELRDLDVLETIGEEQVFPDADSALEWCEDYLLRNLERIEPETSAVSLKSIAALRDMSSDEREILGELLVSQAFAKGARVIREGDTGRDLLFLVKGTISVTTVMPASHRRKRLVTYSPGVVIGELAFLDGSPRSADVWADDDVEVLQLSRDRFDALRREHPELATKFVLNIARELSQRLRSTSAEVRTMGDD